MLKSMCTLTSALLSVMFTVACATRPVQPIYVSKTQYMALDCAGLWSEYKKLNDVLARPMPQYGQSAVRTGVGVNVGSHGWGISPSVMVDLSRMGQENDGLRARYLGERIAVVEAAQDKNCMFVKSLETPVPEKTQGKTQEKTP